jgi:protein-tyrosine kinase
MSKIEKALDRAKQGRGMSLVRTTTGDQVPADTLTNRQENRSVARTSQNMLSRKASTDAIVKMKEIAIRSNEDLATFNIISSRISENPTLHAFRDIRTRLLQHTQGRNGIVLVTTIANGGGSTFVARNLAAAFALDAGRTSLLIDCNLSAPSFQALVNDGNELGLTDYLDKPELSISDIIHPVGIERLRVIPAGSRHNIQGEYFVSDRVRQLFAEMRDRYPDRFVVLDAPPMSESADTRILTELSDYVLLVIPYGKLTTTQIDECIKKIDSQKLIGVIFDDEPQLPPLQFRIEGVWVQLKCEVRRITTQLVNLVGNTFTRKRPS